MKKLKFSWLAVAMLALTPAISSCSSDDNGVTPDGPSSATSTDIDGTRVTRVGNVSIKYDKKDRPYLFTQGNNEIEIDYEEGEINYYDYDELLTTLDVTFNGSGFISTISTSYEIDERDYYEKGSSDMTFSYDGDGHITKMKEVASGKATDYDEDESYSFGVENTIDLTWKKGNLVQIDSKDIDFESGKEVDSWESRSKIEYGREENEYLQFPMSLCYVDMNGLNVFFLVGLFGNGPADLPSSLENNGSGYHDYDITFQLNRNGSISEERMNSTTWSYTYSDITRGGVQEGANVELPRFFSRLKALSPRK